MLRQIRGLLTKAKRTDMSTVEEIAASVHPRGPAIAASRRIAAEALGSAFLLMAVVGSGIMAERLAGGNVAIALLGNTIATGAALVVLISVFRLRPGFRCAFQSRRDALFFAAPRNPSANGRPLRGGATHRRGGWGVHRTRHVRDAGIRDFGKAP